MRAWVVRPARRVRARSCRRGASLEGVKTIVFANAYARSELLPEFASFFANVERLSGGHLRVVFVNGWTSGVDRDEERTLLEDLAAGVADLGWVGARAVGAVFGIRTIEPLLAPLLFPGEEAVRGFLSVAPVENLLAPLEEVGIHGLALLPGGMRRPFGISGPLLSPDDWRGKVIRIHACPTAEAAVRALGGRPVLRSASELRAGLPPGLDGMELHPTAVVGRRYPGWFTSNVMLWPRLLMLAANQRFFERLAPADRAVMTEAARRATASPPRSPSPTEVDLPDTVQLVEASRHDLTFLRRVLEPIHDDLRSDRAGEETLAYVEAFLHPN